MILINQLIEKLAGKIVGIFDRQDDDVDPYDLVALLRSDEVRLEIVQAVLQDFMRETKLIFYTDYEKYIEKVKEQNRYD